MKKILLSAASLAILSGSALAADLPSRKEAVVAPVVAPLWQGFYVGLNAGGAWTDSNHVNLKQDQVYVADGPLRSLTIYNATITGSRSLFMGSTFGIWRGVANIPGVSAGQVISMSQYNANTHFTGSMVRAGVNYHFNLDALVPITAKF